MITMAFEYLITKLIDVSVALPWGFTIALYFMFILYQILIKVNEDAEKNKIKTLLLDLMDSTTGIPIMNKNEKLIIKWDMVFKKLIDNKEYALYDAVVKTKTQHIDAYVNKYPSLLIDETVNLRENRYNMDLNSTIRSKSRKDRPSDEELVKEEESKRKLFIKELNRDTASFSNYNSSLYFDVMLNYEYMPENAPEMGIEQDASYDGFSVVMKYKNNKYNVVPRIMVHKKRINKEKWFVDNINELLTCAEAIAQGDANATIFVDNFKLIDYMEDMLDISERQSYLKFHVLKDELITFTGLNNNSIITAYCELKTAYNRFELVLKSYDIIEGEGRKKVESDKVVAIGTSFQPIVTVLEKMPQLIKNIELVIDNKDLESIVIS